MIHGPLPNAIFSTVAVFICKTLRVTLHSKGGGGGVVVGGGWAAIGSSAAASGGGGGATVSVRYSGDRDLDRSARGSTFAASGAAASCGSGVFNVVRGLDTGCVL